ncbi:MAG: dipeptidase [Pseudomonadota bacterium]
MTASHPLGPLSVSMLALGLAACNGASDAPEPVQPSPETVAEASAPAPAADIDIAALHSRLLTLDTHIDIPLNYMTEIDPAGPTDLQVDQPKLESGRLDSGFWIVYIPQGDLDERGYATAKTIAETRMSAIERLTAERPDFDLAVTAADVRRIVGEGRFAVLVGMENAYPLAEDPASVEDWAARGVRYVGLTHFGHNQFGDSSNPNMARDADYLDGGRHGGLSEMGRDLVAELNAHGVMVDVSHTGKQTMMQAADLSTTPIIASHSGVKAVADSARNLDDEQLRKIAEVGGVAQMVALDVYVKLPTPEQQAAREALDAEYGEAHGPRGEWSEETRTAYGERRREIAAMDDAANVSNFADHIDHAVAVAGIDHVGIASDFDGGGGIDGWRDASETEAVTAELVRRGYSEDEIAKIWGGNLLRVLEAVEAAATEPVGP